MYKTKNLPLASFLYNHREVAFCGVDKTDIRNIYFQFKPEKKAEELSEEFFNNSFALQLFQRYRALKDLVFEARRSVLGNSHRYSNPYQDLE